MGRLLCAALALVLAVLLPGCDSSDTSGITILVEPVDKRSGLLHRVSPNESFSPVNRVAAGESRDVLVKTVGDGRRGPYQFSAGPHGMVSAPVLYSRVNNTSDRDSDDFRVSFGNDGVLLCFDG